MQKTRKYLPLLMLMLACACSSSQPVPKREQVIGDWQVMVLGQGTKDRLCYAGANPTKRGGTITARDSKPYLMVTRRLSGKIELSTSAGYAYMPGSKVELAVDDDDTYTLFFKGAVAWARSDTEDRHITDDMKTAETVEVRGVSQSGLTSLDTYSAKGFAQAVADLRKLCP